MMRWNPESYSIGIDPILAGIPSPTLSVTSSPPNWNPGAYGFRRPLDHSLESRRLRFLSIPEQLAGIPNSRFC